MYSIRRRKLYPESCQSQDTLESLQNSANTLILPNSGLNASELTTVVGLIPLRNGWRLHIVSLMRKCLDGSVTPYFNNYFHLNSSIHTIVTRNCSDTHMLWLEEEVFFILLRQKSTAASPAIWRPRIPILNFQRILRTFSHTIVTFLDRFYSVFFFTTLYSNTFCDVNTVINL